MVVGLIFIIILWICDRPSDRCSTVKKILCKTLIADLKNRQLQNSMQKLNSLSWLIPIKCVIGSLLYLVDEIFLFMIWRIGIVKCLTGLPREGTEESK